MDYLRNTPMAQKFYTLSELAAMIGAEVVGCMDHEISGVASLESAQKTDICFLDSLKYSDSLRTTQAGAVILSQEHASLCEGNALIVADPKLAFSTLLKLFNPEKSVSPGVHPSAVVGVHCCIDKNASVGAHVVVGDHVTIGANTVINSGVHIGDHVSLGASCVIYSRVTVYQGVAVGDRAIIHSGAVIGADGFGFAPDQQRTWVKLLQVGSVTIGNDVEIGANTTIDRGALDDTCIGDGVKIDNLVHIGHNVVIGKHTIIAGSVGIGGSTTIGDYCMMGGACSISDHIHIAGQVVLAGGSSVMRDIKKPGAYGSVISVQKLGDWKKTLLCYWKLTDLFKRVKVLEVAQEKSDEKQ